LGLIRAIALLHQHQRPVREVEHRGEKLRYIEASREDIALANRLAHEVLGRSLDELPPQTRRLLELTDELVAGETKRLGVDRCDYRFSRRQVREHARWGNTQLRVHLDRLVEMEYLLVHRGGRGQGFSYELLFDGRAVAADRFIAGLVDVDGPTAAATTTSTWRGSEAELAGGVRGENGSKTGRLRGDGGATKQHQLGSKPALTVVSDAETHIRSEGKSASYVPARRSRSSLAARAAR
jgi:hypothetical protein